MSGLSLISDGQPQNKWTADFPSDRKRSLPFTNYQQPPMFALREDEEGKFWVYFLHKGRWPLISETPFKTQGEAVEIAMAYDYYKLF
ncbi:MULTISPECIES: hypothetical protein [unclassified Serratia (in: enterobacteria)]|uniref:hypothetical protein n=1 Tax=unclassified Serratia (in: enterobacteria) TaxID=2647522 RepID=UPI002ED1F978|nr:hypothetical protein [Serratia sp. C2(2)]MEE4445201.1 hypothetical protein [Serratia sp. C2(1)]